MVNNLAVDDPRAEPERPPAISPVAANAKVAKSAKLAGGSVARRPARAAGSVAPDRQRWAWFFEQGVTMAAVVVAVALVGLMIGVRAAQGAPPASSFSDVGGGGEGMAEVLSVANVDSATSVAPGDLVVVAGAGDSLWSLAGRFVPNSDRRAAVAAMVDANGGATIVVGQAIVIPSHLLQ